MTIQSIIERAAVKFAKGEDATGELELANRDREKITEWAYTRDDFMSNYFLAVHAKDIFLVGQDIEDYYDPSELRSLDEEGIVVFLILRLMHAVTSAWPFISLSFKAY